jgi:hypothetical protein
MRAILPFGVAFILTLYLGIHNGHLALWDDAHTDPIRVLPYAAELFPEADRQALEDGIPILSRRELTKVLEDYLS